MPNQNTSSAVMQRRHEPLDSLDDFPTPPWATRALCEKIRKHFVIPPLTTVLEPAANRGHMVRTLREYFYEVEGFDVHDYGGGFPVRDFLSGDVDDLKNRFHWVITNPPYRLAPDFIERAMEIATYGVAVLVRTSFLEGVNRHERFYGGRRVPAYFFQFSERVVMHKGKLSEKGSTATSYGWMIFRKRPTEETALRWIEPCRKRLEKPQDYTS